MMAITANRPTTRPRTNIGERAVVTYLQLRRSNFGTTGFLNAIENMPETLRVKRLSSALRGDRDSSPSASPTMSRSSSTLSENSSLDLSDQTLVADSSLVDSDKEPTVSRRVRFGDLEVPPRHERKSSKSSKSKSHSRHKSKSHKSKSKHHHKRRRSSSSSADLSYEYTDLAITQQPLIPGEEPSVLQSFNEIFLMVQILMVYYWTYCVQRYNDKHNPQREEHQRLDF